MNYRLVIRLQGIILCVLSIAFASSLAVAWYYGEGTGGYGGMQAFAKTLGFSLVLAVLFLWLGRGSGRVLHRKEALAVIGLGWLLASAVGAIPFGLLIPEVNWVGAFFESASGFTTTGASVLSDLEALPRSLHYWRALTQWIGGLGVVVFFVAILTFLGAGAKVLYSRESSAQAADLQTARVHKGVWQIIYLYAGLSVACTLVYWACGLGGFEALLHMFTTLSTGGYSTRSASVAAFENPLFEWAVIAFMLIGGTSFPLIIRALRNDRSALWKSTEVRLYYAVAALSSVLITLILWLDANQTASLATHWRAAWFQVVSIMTTTGFATVDFDQWLPVTHVVLLGLMVVGGCSGSTAGGAKVIRIAVLVKTCWLEIEKAHRPQLMRPLRLGGKVIDEGEGRAILVYMVMLSVIAGLATGVVALMEPSMSFEGLISAMAACLFNIGPGFGEVGPTRNFAGLNDWTQLFLSVLMILGRLELYALLVLFAPSLWRKYH